MAAAVSRRRPVGSCVRGRCRVEIRRGTGDEGAEREVVEDFAAVAPDICGAVFPQALVVEAVDGGDLAGFVVASDEGDSIRVADFEAEKQEE